MNKGKLLMQLGFYLSLIGLWLVFLGLCLQQPPNTYLRGLFQGLSYISPVILVFKGVASIIVALFSPNKSVERK